MQDAPKAVWSIPFVSLAFFPSLKHNFIAYRSSKVSSRPDWIFEIHQQWQSDFSRVYSNSCSSCWFEAEIIKIDQSSYKMYSNNILNFQDSTTILNACTKSLETYWRHHAISECSKLAQMDYKTRHDQVGKVIHWEMCKKFKFDHTKKWYMHNPVAVLENDTQKLLWDFDKQTDHQISTRRPDLVAIDKKRELGKLTTLLSRLTTE